MQQRILPGRGSGGLSWTCAGRHGLALGGELLQRGLQPVEVVDDALHGELRRVALLHRAGDVDHAAVGHQAGQHLAVRRRLEQHKFHEFLPCDLRGIQHIPRTPASRPRAAHIGPHISACGSAAQIASPRPAAISFAPEGAGVERLRQPQDDQGVTTMAVIKVTDIAYVRLRSPDLDLQAEFLDNFGLVAERQERQGDLLSRHRSGASRPHHREGRSEVRRHRLSRRERGRSQDARQGARRLRHREHGRAGRRQARSPDRAERLPDRSGLGHGQGQADRGAAPVAQLRLRAARARRRSDAHPEGPVAAASASPTPCSARRR